MNALERLVSSGMKRQGISKGDLASKVGYKNINKGLRRIDAFLRDPDQGSQLSVKLVQVLSIPKGEFASAIKEARCSIEQKERLLFKPFIQVRLMKPPSPVFVAAMVPSLTRIEVPGSLMDMPYDEELEAVCELYKNHHERYSPGWPARDGFCYFRNYDESLSFDVDGRLLEGQQCEPYSFKLRI